MALRRALLAAWLALAPALPAGGAPPEDAMPPQRSAAERIEEIRRRVQEATVYPEAARRRGVSGVTRVQFQVGLDGRAEGIEVVRTSGHPLLDRAARRGVVAAGVLPRVFGRLQIPVRFELDGREP